MKIETQLKGERVAQIRPGDLLRVVAVNVEHLSDGLYEVIYELERVHTPQRLAERGGSQSANSLHRGTQSEARSGFDAEVAAPRRERGVSTITPTAGQLARIGYRVVHPLIASTMGGRWLRAFIAAGEAGR